MRAEHRSTLVLVITALRALIPLYRHPVCSWRNTTMSATEAPPVTHNGSPVENDPLLPGGDTDESGPVFDDVADIKLEYRKGDHVEKFVAIVSAELFSHFIERRCLWWLLRLQCWFVYSELISYAAGLNILLQIISTTTWIVVFTNDPKALGWFAPHPVLQTLALLFFTYGALNIIHLRSWVIIPSLRDRDPSTHLSTSDQEVWFGSSSSCDAFARISFHCSRVYFHYL